MRYRRPFPDALPRDSERNRSALSLNYLGPFQESLDSHRFAQTLFQSLRQTVAISCYSPDQSTGQALLLPRHLFSLEFRS